MIDYESGEIAVITLNAPERRNALNHADFTALNQALDQVIYDKPRVVIFAGAGSVFCAGVDFGALLEGEWVDNNPLSALCARIDELPMPTIAALNGHFIGGGAELAMSCDFRIAIPQARCQIPAAKIGVHYEPDGIVRVASIVGLQNARRLFLGLQSFCGEELVRHNFVDALEENPELAARELATKLAKLAPLSLSGTKVSLRALRDGADDSSARDRIREAFASHDHSEAIAAIRAKRKPVFKGY